MRKRLENILIVFVMLTLTLQYVAAVCVQDEDGDNYGLGCDAGEDCNDADSNVNAGMQERCENAVDDNCNGVVDEEPCTYCEDHDGDGYGSRCSAGEDCNDADSNINSGAGESTFSEC